MTEPDAGDKHLDASADATVDAPPCAFGQLICDGRTEKTCDGHGGFWFVKECPTQCQDGLGCVDCIPGEAVCNPGVGLAKVCLKSASTTDAGGYASERTFACSGPGMTCAETGCTGPCSPTELGGSNIGCEFWPTTTANYVWSGDGGLRFGVLVANTSERPANIAVKGTGSNAATSVANVVVPPREARAIELDLVPELKGPDWQTPYVPIRPLESVNKLSGAYRLQSDQPIVAYQFNTLQTQTPSGACPRLAWQSDAGPCYAFSTEASLLLPAHVLSGQYVVTGYRPLRGDQVRDGGVPPRLGDFLAITAIEDNTTLDLSLPGMAPVLAWAELPRLTAGAKAELSMGAGQVIELFTEPGLPERSFAGTTVSVRNQRRVQVLAGHACASVPDNSGPCAHMEDSVLPTEALGTRYVLLPLGAPENPAPYSARILAVSESTAVQFDPPTIHKPVTIEKGTVLEIPSVAVPVMIEATQPIAVVQYSDSRGVPASPTDDAMQIAGPAQLSVVPCAQYRSKYVFAIPPHALQSYVHVVASTGAEVAIDGTPIPADRFAAVAASGLSFAVHGLGAEPAPTLHTIESAKPVGIVIEGRGPYSRYLYAGGLSLETHSGP